MKKLKKKWKKAKKWKLTALAVVSSLLSLSAFAEGESAFSSGSSGRPERYDCVVKSQGDYREISVRPKTRIAEVTFSSNRSVYFVQKRGADDVRVVLSGEAGRVESDAKRWGEGAFEFQDASSDLKVECVAIMGEPSPNRMAASVGSASDDVLPVPGGERREYGLDLALPLEE